MAILVSPGVQINEVDLTTQTPAVSTSIGALAGVFSWGPANTPVQISSEVNLNNTFGNPDANTSNSFFTAVNFLSYSNNLQVVRAQLSGANNAMSNTNYGANVSMPNEGFYFSNTTSFGYNQSGNQNNSTIARYPGNLGNSLQVIYWPSATAWAANANATFNVAVGGITGTGSTTSSVNLVSTILTTPNTTPNSYVGGVLTISSGYGANGAINSATIVAYNTVTNLVTLNANLTFTPNGTSNVTIVGVADPLYQFAKLFPYAPGTSPYVANKTGNPNVNDEIHIAVVDATGLITGYANTPLETYTSVSVLSDAIAVDGSTNYYKEVLYRKSKWVLWTGHPTTNTTGWGALSTTPALTIYKDTRAHNRQLGNGADGISYANPATLDSALINALTNFRDPEAVNISLLMTADFDSTVQQQAIQLAAARQDCVAFVSPPLSATQDPVSPANAITTYFNSTLNTFSSYAVADTGWKYQYDKYNDQYRWIPLNGDIAGLCAYTDNVKAPWWSPAGFQRGVLNNVIQLAFNPNQAARDQLYKAGINPVVSFPGQGTVLYGDKTMQNRPSAFDRINVRRLFIVLEKTIGQAAKNSLFEFNDAFTQAQFVALVDPFLRTVQAQRGIYAYKIVCDSTNNTPAVIDANQFRGDIYIQPAKSANFITLNFVAVRTGVSFSEVVGQF